LSNNDNDAYGISIILLKKDGSLYIYYSYIVEDYIAYKYNKINNLVTNGLFYIEKYKGFLIILNIIIDTWNRYLEFLDPVSI
jgi:hypothetical protein